MSDPTVLSLEVRVVEIFSPLGRILVSLSSCLQNLSFILNEVMLEVAFWEDLVAAPRGYRDTPHHHQGLHLGSKEPESCWAAVEFHSAALSVPGKLIWLLFFGRGQACFPE